MSYLSQERKRERTVRFRKIHRVDIRVDLDFVQEKQSMVSDLDTTFQRNGRVQLMKQWLCLMKYYSGQKIDTNNQQ